MPQKFVNLENLTSFWGNAKEYIGNERNEIENQLYNWQKTEKAPIVQCEPVPNSELHPTVEFKFKEILPEGEKGLDNPSTINGVNTVKLLRHGKNVCPSTIMYNVQSNVTTTSNPDGSITFNGTVSNTALLAYIWAVMPNEPTWPDYIKHNTRYYFSMYGNSQDISFVVYRSYTNGFGSASLRIHAGETGVLVMPDETSTKLLLRFEVPANTVLNNVTVKVQIEEESVTEFEKSDIYSCAVNLNDTYYGGSIDFSTGLMTVTHYGIIFDSITANAFGYSFNTNSSNENYDRRIAVQLNGSVSGFPQCVSSGYDYTESSITHFNFDSQLSSNFTYRIQGLPANWLVIKDDSGVLFNDSRTVAENKQYFLNWCDAQKTAGTPVTLCYKLQTPFTVQLTPQQIKSLPSLEGTSKRINTIYTDADSIQVEYQKYVGIDSTLDSSSVNAIQNKVVNSALNTKVSLTGNETIAGSKTFSSPINGSVTGDAGTVAGHIVSKDVPVNAAFTDTTYDPATQSTAGLMSASDKAKLDAVGSVFSFKGSVVNSSSLPASDNNNGDAYLAEDTGHVHVYDGSSFVDIGVWAGIPSATDAQIDALFED